MFVIVRVSKCQHPALPIHLDSSQFISLPRQPSALFRFSSPIFLRDLWKFVTTRNKPTIGSFRYPRVPLCSLHSKQNCYVFSLLFFADLSWNSLHEFLISAPIPPHKCFKNFPRAKPMNIFWWLMQIENWKKKKKMIHMTKLSKFNYFTPSDHQLFHRDFHWDFHRDLRLIDEIRSLPNDWSSRHWYWYCFSYSIQDNIWFQFGNKKDKSV